MGLLRFKASPSSNQSRCKRFYFPFHFSSSFVVVMLFACEGESEGRRIDTERGDWLWHDVALDWFDLKNHCHTLVQHPSPFPIRKS